ncbi:MAG: MBL fold metallo-hydrolase [Clostridia bacterium]|nr:MBL fold metallo-hydrolase [Clostridia bacterium]
MKEIKVTTLSENTAGPGFLAEWGLSILVEAEGSRILLDTGAGFSAIHNAQLLGLDLRMIDRIVLSHGHYDHTGGLRAFLRRMGREVQVVAHPDVWAAKYARRGQGALEPGEGTRYVGLPFQRAELESLGARFLLRREPTRLGEHILTSGEIPLATAYEEIDASLLLRDGENFVPDPLADDLALILEAEFGLVVILGCAHRGLINTLDHARALTGRERIYAVIGGTHLLRASPERLDKTIAALKEMGVAKLGVSHCTGFYAAARLAAVFEDAFFLNNAGTSLSLP